MSPEFFPPFLGSSVGTQIRGQEVQFGTLWEGSQGIAGLHRSSRNSPSKWSGGGGRRRKGIPGREWLRGVTAAPLLETRAGQRQEIWGDRRDGLSPDEPKAGQPSGQDSRMSPPWVRIPLPLHCEAWARHRAPFLHLSIGKSSTFFSFLCWVLFRLRDTCP